MYDKKTMEHPGLMVWDDVTMRYLGLWYEKEAYSKKRHDLGHVLTENLMLPLEYELNSATLLVSRREATLTLRDTDNKTFHADVCTYILLWDNMLWGTQVN